MKGFTRFVLFALFFVSFFVLLFAVLLFAVLLFAMLLILLVPLKRPQTQLVELGHKSGSDFVFYSVWSSVVVFTWLDVFHSFLRIHPPHYKN